VGLADPEKRGVEPLQEHLVLGESDDPIRDRQETLEVIRQRLPVLAPAQELLER
jgi:hypothetical protein